MGTSDPNNSRQNQPVSAVGVLELCAELTDGFTHGPVLMPIVVLQAEQPLVPDPPEVASDPAAALVDDLHRAYMMGRVRCRRLPNAPGRRFKPSVPKSPLPRLDGTLGEYDDALTLVRALSTGDDWDNARRSPYRPYSFPRSKLLYAIEEAVGKNTAAAGETIASGKALAAANASANENVPGGESTPAGQRSTSGTRPDQMAVLKRLNSPRRRRPVIGALSALRSVMVVLMPVVAIVLSVELTTLSTPKWAPWALLGTGLIIMVSWLVLTWRQSVTAPLSGLYPGGHWLATSTFIIAADDDEPTPRFERLAVLLPRWSRRMRTVREERARLIISQLSTAFYGSPSAEDAMPGQPAASTEEREGAMQQYLSLRVHALLEDLRASYRPWSLDLRRRKRKWPPMLFLPNVGIHPGHVRFVQAVSDLRSRRSETDPLLILASSKNPLSAHPGPEPDDSRSTPYKRWIRRLRVEQSPSLAKRLPWVLIQKVQADPGFLPKRGRDLPRAGWSGWLLWSRWTVAIAVLLLCAGGFWRSQMISGEYCGGWLFGHDPNLVLINGECIGTDTTSSPAFLPAGMGVTLSGAPASGATPAIGSTVSLSQVSLAYLEDLIDQQNLKATASGSYVTFVYAGALTAPASSPNDPVSAMQELAGVFAWQYYVNAIVNDHVEIRIDIANDGDNSLHERRMAETVKAAADNSTSIAGVIGLGVDTSQSGLAIQDFADAGLPILDTTNSDNSFPNDWNYFGLSPTNAEEAQALVNRYASHAHGRHAMVFERVEPSDPYTEQQAQSAERALAKAGFKPPEPIQYTTQTAFTSSQYIKSAVCAYQPSVIYLAGRHQDIKQLVDLLDQDRDCFPRDNVTVLSGDDMAVTEFPGTSAPALAPQMTLYYVAQTDPAHVPKAPGADGAASEDNGSGLSIDLQQALHLGSVPGYQDPVFANGLMALGFDAADLLYSASTTGTGADEHEQALSRPEVAPRLRCPLGPVGNGATGQLGFTNVSHGLDFFKAANAAAANATAANATAANATGANATGGGANPQLVTFQPHPRLTATSKCLPNVASSRP